MAMQYRGWLLLTMAAGAVTPATGAAAVYLVNENFNSYAPYSASPPGDESPTGFAEAVSGGTASVRIQPDSPTGNDYEFAVSGTGVSASSVAFSTTSLASVPGTNFTITGEMQLDSFANTTSTGAANSGLVFLCTSGTNTSSNAIGYRLTYALAGTNAGQFTLYEGAGTSNTARAASGTLSAAVGTIYTMTVTGTYATPGVPSSTLLITATLSDGTTTRTLSYNDASPVTGSYFGFRNAVSTGTTSGTTASNFDFDNYAVAIPEPASAVFAGGVLLLGLTRRRRASI